MLGEVAQFTESEAIGAVIGDVDRGERQAIHRREGERFPSKLADAEWAHFAPLIPPASPRGRPRETDMRAAMNAVFHLLRTECPWR